MGNRSMNEVRALIEHVAKAMWDEGERLRALIRPIEVVPWERCPEHLRHTWRCMASAGLRSINVDSTNARIDPTFNVNAMANVKTAGSA